MYNTGINESGTAAFVSSDGGGIGPALLQMLLTSEIVPGSAPGYQLCKQIFSYHPLGAILTDAPITRAQSKSRDINVSGLAEKRLIAQYEATWKTLGKVGGTMILHSLCSMARMYGIASLAVGEIGRDPSTPLDHARIAKADLFFNILDPLNTAGSLVLNQDPNSPDFLKPVGAIHVAGQHWHPSRLFVKFHGQPLYIDWTSSAFGFVGRSVYQSALYPLKSFVQSMITDQLVVQKAGLLVYKAEQPGSFIDNVMQSFFGQKRAAVKAGVTGQVLSIGVSEAIETLNMQNLDKAFSTARTNILKNIASAAGMPASIILQETLAEGFGEGAEDANKEIDYLNYIREEMDSAYSFLDAICRRKAWTPAFYATLAQDYPEFGEGGYDRALHDWIRAFSASWPNLKIEPDSEKVKIEDVQMKAVVGLLEIILPQIDPASRAKAIAWAADNVNSREVLFASKLDIDESELEAYLLQHESEQQEQSEELATGKPRQPRPFSAAS